MSEGLSFFTIYLGGLVLFGATGFPVAVVILIITLVSFVLIIGSQLFGSLADLTWSTMNNFLLIAMPLFVLLGDIMLRSGMTERMYHSISLWVHRVPGGLLHSNIMACALFSASTGSSVATAATMGRVALPELVKRGYHKGLSLGSVAAGGALGILIPPSINLVIYGVMTDTSIGRLLIAGIIPGMLLATFFMAHIMIYSILRPDVAPFDQDRSPTLAVRIAGLPKLLPPLVVILSVIGSIYAGIATPTEAAAMGIIAAVLLAALYRGLSIRMLNDCFRSTVQTTGMIMAIITAAFLMNFVVGYLGIPQAIGRWVGSLGLSAHTVLWILLGIYILLGCFLEGLSMIIMTIPIVAPLVFGLGIDPVWFGVFTVLVTELGMLTPPVGMILYVVQGVRPDSGSVVDVMVGAAPFVATILIFVVVTMYFPTIVTWLPDTMMNR